MSYGGIEMVEVDEEYGLFYVLREGGYWNKYKISEEQNFLNWIYQYEGDDPNSDIRINELYSPEEEEYEEEEIYDEFENNRYFDQDDGWGW